MSQIILDDQLFDLEVLIPLARWTTVQRLRDLRPAEVIKDDRVPLILREQRQPTFVTIDMGFWDPTLRDPRYCILCFPLRNDEQREIPDLLHSLLRFAEFSTKSSRMGKVARISLARIEFWQSGDPQLQRLAWPKAMFRI